MSVPPLFRRMVDDASVLPPGGASLREAAADHRGHHAAWYAELVGTMLVPAADLDDLRGVPDPAQPIAIGLVGELPWCAGDWRSGRAAPPRGSTAPTWHSSRSRSPSAAR